MVFRLTLKRFTCCVLHYNNQFKQSVPKSLLFMLRDLSLTLYTINSLPVSSSIYKPLKTWLILKKKEQHGKKNFRAMFLRQNEAPMQKFRPPLFFHPNMVLHSLLISLFFKYFCLFSLPSHSSVSVLFSLSHFARKASIRSKLQENYLSAFGIFSTVQNTRVLGGFAHKFNKEVNGSNIPCADWLNYLITQLKVFVGRICL